jgi:hypothetical protein
MTEAGGSAYTEILITLQGCAPEDPGCLISIGLTRDIRSDVPQRARRQGARAPAVARQSAREDGGLLVND